MRAGKLRHRVELQALVASKDAAGGVVKGWATVRTVWADVRYLNGLETVRADAPAAMVRASIRIRSIPGVVASMRAVHGARTLDIKAVLPDETDRDYLDLACEQGFNNG